MKRILVVNRGEIASRILRTIGRMGLCGLACYSDADAQALFVRQSHEAYHLGPSAALESYLNIPRIIELAQRVKADAIHPGYGFLSERADFAKACQQAGIVFIGPSAEAIEAMGLKDEAIRRVVATGKVPVLPSDTLDLSHAERWKEQADAVGYPLLIKPVAGGGGKGMYVVSEGSELEPRVHLSRSEALSAFGDDRLMIERFITQARHVEIQIFMDAHGEGVYLGERDCSVQRRRQKIIEESPAVDLPDAVRTAMGTAAVEAAKSIGYCGAGTVEFLMDDAHRFYFMEMNTRLQVEHPVTEMRYGVDLVEWQIRVARGERLPKKQDECVGQGHVMELRLNAEDPARQFMPSYGKLNTFDCPTASLHSDEHVRWDVGYEQGDEVPPYYDSLMAKLIVHTPTRERTLACAQNTLAQTNVLGVQHNVSLLQRILAHPAFRAGGVSTSWLEQELPQWDFKPSEREYALGTLWRYHQAQQQIASSDPWQQPQGWRMNQSNEWHQSWMNEAETVFTRLTIIDDRFMEIKVNQNPWIFEPQNTKNTFFCQNDQKTYVLSGRNAEGTCVLNINGLSTVLVSPRYQPHHSQAETQGALMAPMPSVVVRCAVKPGESVSSGQLLMVLEAMKMQHQVLAPYSGVVEELYFQPGQQVAEGALLLRLNEAQSGE